MSSTSTRDVTIVSGPSFVKEFDVQDRTTSSSTVIYPGNPVKVNQSASNYVVNLATAEPTSAAPMLGIAESTSTETTTADGKVKVSVVVPGQTVLRCKATTVGNIDTAAELLGVMNDSVTFDLTSTTFTIDEDEGTDPNVHGLMIIDGDISAGTLDFVVKGYAQEYTSSY